MRANRAAPVLHPGGLIPYTPPRNKRWSSGRGGLVVDYSYRYLGEWKTAYRKATKVPTLTRVAKRRARNRQARQSRKINR